MKPGHPIPVMLGSACTLLIGTYVAAQVPKEETRKAAVPAEAQVKQPAVRLEMMKQAVVPAKAVGGMFAAPAAQPRQAQIQQLTQQLRPVLRVEYHFVRTVCKLNKDERRQIARAGERALKEAASRTLGTNINGARIFNAGEAVPVEARADDPRKLIQEALAKAVKQVSSEEAARYTQELKRKEEHAKQVAVRNIVARVDQDLFLTTDQRAAMTKSLLSHWDDSWGLSVQALVNIDHYFPPIPDSCIIPALNPVQKDVWHTVQVNRRVIRFGVSFGVDDGIEDEELTEAREAEARQEADH